jgi:N-hydroxyarylamine O-acetyltransferase
VAADGLTPELTDAVVARLGLPARPDPDLPGLAAVYAAWCSRVPFDNVRKRIHLTASDPGPLPGHDAADFFGPWLRHGTGGTCWAGNGALCDLLTALGFDAGRGIATMMAAPDLPPNHGTVAVDLDGGRYLVDASILHGAPLLLRREPTGVEHPAWGVRATPLEGGRWVVTWPSLHRPEGFDCRIERFGATADEFRALYEPTRERSGFNTALYVRLNGDGTAFGAIGERRIEIAGPGDVTERTVAGEDRIRFLVEEVGIDEETARRLPPDLPRD